MSNCYLHAAVAIAMVTAAAGNSAHGEANAPISVACLKGMSACELDVLFAAAEGGDVPVGFGRGTVLCYVDQYLPRLKARSAGMWWKGKHFDCQGGIVNQWVGVKAIRTCSRIESSWCDGGPCVVIDYARGTPIFGNARDELRCIAPGLYLGRFYDRCPCPRHRGYFVLQFDGCP